MPPTSDEMSKLTITIPSDLHRKAKAIAAMQDVAVADILRSALKEYVESTMEQDDDIRSILQIEADVKAGRERAFTWNELKQERSKRRGVRKKAG